MNQSDPTDHALAAIASILDHPETQREPEKLAIPEKPAVEDQPVAPVAPEPIEADGYSKIGPGPMAAIRFRWTVRREANDEYFVDETIGENSAPVVSGPLAPDEAIRFVDDRASEARERFEQIRSEMSGRAAAANLLRKDVGEM
ncbi:MAG: hypothetical protein Q7T45_22845 [Bradyrhizobium sp.]|uniref:hypothetical protein n=1 Tax=Bradyrhizobium sp. TaxID=376 RepID=UPI00272561BD|nr:hypothetical protein [Bradyrhizobium sp.]MDO8400656.1 hypothetical protein [Bradyrhizobium sp.]